MDRSFRTLAGFAAASVLLCACGSQPSLPSPSPRVTGTPAAATPPPNAGAYKIGSPYQVAGIWYYPKEQPTYDETGIASWYGEDFHGRLTADGEVFDRNAITAAHPTLPMPVNVRVTNLENGKSIVVRVNDRGPYVNGRVIDLSEHAADLLGYRLQGTAKVRVTYLGRADGPNGGAPPPAEETPPEIAVAVAAAPTPPVSTEALPPVTGVPVEAGAPAKPLPTPVPLAPVIATPQDLPTGQVSQVAVPAATSIYVQAGAYGSLDNAKRVADKLASLGAKISTIMRDGKPLYRVRIGPMQNVDQADATLNSVHDLGHNDVNIVVE
jgi:rare lipoprotein A